MFGKSNHWFNDLFLWSIAPLLYVSILKEQCEYAYRYTYFESEEVKKFLISIDTAGMRKAWESYESYW